MALLSCSFQQSADYYKGDSLTETEGTKEVRKIRDFVLTASS